MSVLTFLKAAGSMPMAKVFSPNHTSSYPLTKRFTSEEVTFAEPLFGRQLLTVLRQKANENAILLKGPLIRPLEMESRKGLADRDAVTSLLVLDLDNVTTELPEPPYTEKKLARVAERLVKELPEPLSTSDYVVQASNSFGRKADKVSLHIFFALAAPIQPRMLKNLLYYLNFESPFYRERITLNENALSLHYPIDTTLADNTRLIYIAHPVFLDLPNPFEDNEQRYTYVAKECPQLDLASLMEKVAGYNPRPVQNRVLNALRTSQGLAKRQEKTTSLNINNERVDVITNPDEATLHIVADEGRYLRCNINNGDSQAYYIDKRHPSVVWNFKGERPFLLEPADPELYRTLMEDLRGKAEAGDKELLGVRQPMCFRDIPTDTIYAGFTSLDGSDLFEAHPIRLTSLEDFFTFHGHVPPVQVPQVYYEFRPWEDVQIDMPRQFINQYRPNPLWVDPPQIPEEMQGLTLGDAAALKQLAPTVYKVIHSALGSDDEEFEYFINWVAYVAQVRRKVGTAWILQGVQGTGKGVMFNMILKPLLGDGYCATKTSENIEDDFNDWVSRTLLVLLDEFKSTDGANATKMHNRLKHLITEEETTARGMRENQRSTKSYTNFIIATNDRDTTTVPEDDRRINVAPRQEVQLLVRYPELAETLEKHLLDETPLFVAFIKHFHIDRLAARTVRETEHKKLAREASRNTHERFCSSIKHGNLDYLIDYFEDPPKTAIEFESAPAYNTIIKRLIADAGGTSFLTITDLRVLYARIQGKWLAPEALGRAMRIYGLEPIQKRTGAGRHRGYDISFNAADYNLEELIHSVADKNFVTRPAAPTH